MPLFIIICDDMQYRQLHSPYYPSLDMAVGVETEKKPCEYMLLFEDRRSKLLRKRMKTVFLWMFEEISV